MGQSSCIELPKETWSHIASYSTIYKLMFVNKLIHGVALQLPVQLDTQRHTKLTMEHIQRLNVSRLIVRNCNSISCIGLSTLRNLALYDMSGWDLSMCPALEILQLHRCSKIIGLTQLVNLHTLTLRGPVVSHRDDLSALTNVTSLTLAGQTAMPNRQLLQLPLRHLDISFNRSITNQDLAGLQLQVLNIMKSAAGNFGINHMTSLTDLNASMSLVDPATLPISITRLNITMCDGNMLGITALTNLTDLQAAGTNVSRAHIAALPRLRTATYGNFTKYNCDCDSGAA